MHYEWHSQVELFYVLKGKGRYFIEDKIYEFEEGDFFIISNYELHKSQFIDNERFEAFVIIFDPKLIVDHPILVEDKFDPLQLFINRPKNFSHKLKTDTVTRKKIRLCLDLLAAEYFQENGFSLRRVISLLHWLLSELYRHYNRIAVMDEAEITEHKGLKKFVSDVVQYISEHYYEDITLSKLAKKFCINPSYLSREFKKNLGITIIEFITVRRIFKAKILLERSDLPITEIASQLGFNNITHFNWTFKKIVGISPSKYRKFSKNGLVGGRSI
jgi:AraC-like DNA-binding protein